MAVRQVSSYRGYTGRDAPCRRMVVYDPFVGDFTALPGLRL